MKRSPTLAPLDDADARAARVKAQRWRYSTMRRDMATKKESQGKKGAQSKDDLHGNERVGAQMSTQEVVDLTCVGCDTTSTNVCTMTPVPNMKNQRADTRRSRCVAFVAKSKNILDPQPDEKGKSDPPLTSKQAQTCSHLKRSGAKGEERKLVRGAKGRGSAAKRTRTAVSDLGELGSTTPARKKPRGTPDTGNLQNDHVPSGNPPKLAKLSYAERIELEASRGRSLNLQYYQNNVWVSYDKGLTESLLLDLAIGLRVSIVQSCRSGILTSKAWCPLSFSDNLISKYIIDWNTLQQVNIQTGYRRTIRVVDFETGKEVLKFLRLCGSSASIHAMLPMTPEAKTTLENEKSSIELAMKNMAFGHSCVGQAISCDDEDYPRDMIARLKLCCKGCTFYHNIAFMKTF